MIAAKDLRCLRIPEEYLEHLDRSQELRFEGRVDYSPNGNGPLSNKEIREYLEDKAKKEIATTFQDATSRSEAAIAISKPRITLHNLPGQDAMEYTAIIQTYKQRNGSS